MNELSTLAEKLLEVPAVLIETAMALELAEKTIVKDGVEGTEWVFLGREGCGRSFLKLAVRNKLVTLRRTQKWPR